MKNNRSKTVTIMIGKYFQQGVLFLIGMFLITGCEEDKSPTILRNDCLHRSWGIHMVGEEMYFAYAAAIPPELGKINAVKVVASIPGGPNTRIDPRLYKIDASGHDVGTTVALNIPQTNPAATKVNLVIDTCAVTLRYYYDIPEEARGKHVHFDFYAEASNGDVVTYRMGPYTCSRQDYRTGLQADNDRRYISIEDMAVYTWAEIKDGSKKIDVVYTYEEVKTPTSPGGSGSIGGLNKCFFSPTTAAKARIKEFADIELPQDERNTKIRESAHAKDEVIEQSKWHLYITDEDFRALDFDRMGYSNLVTNFVTEYNCLWLETEDGKYRAWIWVNTKSSVHTDKITFGMKRYEID